MKGVNYSGAEVVKAEAAYVPTVSVKGLTFVFSNLTMSRKMYHWGTNVCLCVWGPSLTPLHTPHGHWCDYTRHKAESIRNIYYLHSWEVG